MLQSQGLALLLQEAPFLLQNRPDVTHHHRHSALNQMVQHQGHQVQQLHLSAVQALPGQHPAEVQTAAA
jgi:hypothetical protein